MFRHESQVAFAQLLIGVILPSSYYVQMLNACLQSLIINILRSGVPTFHQAWAKKLRKVSSSDILCQIQCKLQPRHIRSVGVAVSLFCVLFQFPPTCIWAISGA